MQLINDSIKAIFGRMPVTNSHMTTNSSSIDPYYFKQAIRQTNLVHTEDQINNILSFIKETFCCENELQYTHNFGDDSIFNILLHFTDLCLNTDGDTPKVKYSHLLKWQDVTSFLGEDLFTTAALASKDTSIAVGAIPRKMNWNELLMTDNDNLESFLKESFMSDIHSHLFGSSLNFALTWLFMMNYPLVACEISNSVSQFRSLSVLPVSDVSHVNTLQDKIILAALLRYNLYNDNLDDGDIKLLADGKVDDVGIRLEEKTEVARNEVGSSNDDISIRYGSKSVILDYAVVEIDYEGLTYLEKSLAAIHSERRFLYSQFSKLLDDDVDDGSKTMRADLFYKYILLKSHIRREFVQLNDSLGFAYFDGFDQRKTFPKCEKGKIYNGILAHLAVASGCYLSPEKRYIELRIAPPGRGEGSLKDRLKNNIKYIDAGIFTDWKKGDNPKLYDFTVHFIKCEDVNYKENLPSRSLMRHSKLRSDLLDQASKVYDLMSSEGSNKKRLVGIDAAHSEIFCRPEVFAQVFRFLVGESRELARNKNDKSYIIGQTYHVGEDYLDVIDGLRAIDEVLHYMNFDSSSRIGHALVLGEDVDKYYEKRDNRVELKAQMLLDNVVWLWHKADLLMDQECKSSLESKFLELRDRIYGHNPTIAVYGIKDFYDSWLLRGDNAERYPDHMDYNDIGEKIISKYDYSRNDICDEARNNHKAKELYSFYHTDGQARIAGERIAVWKVNRDIKSIIEKSRLMMIEEVIKRDIHLECNPTSNIRIGGIRRYDHHPILKFQNDVIYDDLSKVLSIDDRRRMSVSLNTDDKGIFDTSLEREVSLMVRAVDKKLGNDFRTQKIAVQWVKGIIYEGNHRAFKNLKL